MIICESQEKSQKSMLIPLSTTKYINLKNFFARLYKITWSFQESCVQMKNLSRLKSIYIAVFAITSPNVFKEVILFRDLANFPPIEFTFSIL